MADVEVPRVPDRRIPAGWSPPYDPPFGKLSGLPDRIGSWCKRLRSPGLPWAGLGLIRDLEMVMRLLTLREFGEFLRSRAGIDSEWGDEIIAAADAADELEELQADIERAVPVEPGEIYADAVERAAKLGERMRAVLVETGALADNDTETDPADLLRLLLS